jgi:hypothetical protein
VRRFVWLICSAFLVAAIVALGPIAGARKPNPACPSRDGRIRVASDKAVVFAKKGTHFYACRYQERRVYFLGRNRGFGVPVGRLITHEDFRLNGRYVAFLILNSRDPGVLDTSIEVFDLAKGRVLRRVDSPEDAAWDNLVLAANGGIGWLEGRQDVLVLDAAGKRLVDTGNVSDLAVSGTTLYWTNDGAPRSVALR